MADFEINGVSATEYGFSTTELPDVFNTPQFSYVPITLPGRPGQRVGRRVTGNKPFGVRGQIRSTSIADASSNLHLLTAICQGTAQPSTVIFGMSTSKRLSAECLGLVVQNLTGPLAIPRVDEVRILFDAPDPPFFEGTTVTTVSVTSSGAVACPQGNAPVWPAIIANGTTDGASAFTVTLYDSTGAEVGALTIGDAPTSSEYVVIDMNAMTVYLNETQVASSGTTLIGVVTFSTASDFWHIKTEYSDFAASSWAQVGVSTGVTADVRYRKAWWQV